MNAPSEALPDASRLTRDDALALAGLLALVVLLFFDVLFDAGRVYSHWRGDTFRYFVHYRAFGFEELARGDLPLWNPHTFAGVPFVGGFQSAMFYPLNLVYLLFPIGTALDLEALLATLLMAIGTYAWARNAGQSPLAGFLAAVTATLGATFWLRIMAGMETVTSTLAWCPLLFLAVDRTLARPTLGVFLLTTLGFAMQLLAGYPTYAVLTVIALGLYLLCRLPSSEHKVRAVLSIGGAGVFALALAAVQLGPGMETTAESVRSLGITFGFASSFPMPPENFWLLLAPELFGDVLEVPYWGRSFYWDANPYFGVASLVLALLGLVRAPRTYSVPILVLVLFFGLASIGRHLSFYYYLYEWIPLFRLVRAPSKLLFFACFPLALAAGFGVDALRRGELGRAWVVFPAGTTALILAAAAYLQSASGTAAWDALLERSLASPDAWYSLCAEHLAAAPDIAQRGLWAAAIAAAALTVVWLAPSRIAAFGAVAIASLQLTMFAATYRGGFDLEWIEQPTLEKAARAGGVDRRIFNPGADLARNRVMGVGGTAVWGYEPVTLGRYSRFIRIASNFNLNEVYLTALRPMRLGRHAALLRVGSILKGPKKHVREKPNAHLQTERDPPLRYEALPNPVGRFLLLTSWKLTDFDDYDRAKKDLFLLPFRQQVLLEESPGFPSREGRVRGNVEIVEESNDEMLLDVQVAQDTILVVTDAYSTQWKAEPAASGGPQDAYEVVPADLALRGIPLRAGSHRIRLYYDSPGLRYGAVLSVLALLGYLGVVVAWVRQRRVGSL